jgi:predicted transcriptional regulator
MSDRSLFYRSLDVLTCIWNKETDLDAICENVGLDSNRVEELLARLAEWELLEDGVSSLMVTERGKNVLSFYHNYSRALKVQPMVRAIIPDY